MDQDDLFLTDKEMNDEYSMLTHSLGVSVSKHLLDEHFTVVWANDFYYELIGYPREEYISIFHNQCDLYFSEFRDSWDAIVNRVTQAVDNGEKSYSIFCRMPKKGGNVIWVKIVGTFTSEYYQGKRISYTVMTDVTEMFQMKKERSIAYSNIPGFVAKYRIGAQDAELLEANDKLIDFFGLDKHNLKNFKAFSSIAPKSVPMFKQQLKKMREGQSVAFVTQMIGKGGEIALIRADGECVEQVDGDYIYLILYIDITDVTELRMLQKQLEESAVKLTAALAEAEKANRAKSEFLARMSHDLRTPMNAIVGMTAIASNRLDDKEKVADCLNKITVSSKHLLGLVNDVLDMSGIESGELALNPTEVFLPDFCENIYTILQPILRDKKLKYRVVPTDVMHEGIVADELRLSQIFLNILSNACKFTPERGRITLEMRELSTEDPSRSLFEFKFSDTGIGMSNDFLEHIFDVFARENDSRTGQCEGSGLGMAITKKIVQVLGGEITVRSEKGEGTVFRVRIPFETIPPEKMKKCEHHYKLLMINAQKGIDAALSRLKELGLEVDFAKNAEEAGPYLVTKRYDAIMFDWNDTDAQAKNTLRKEASDKDTVLIASSYDWSEIESEARSLGIDAHVGKPIFASTVCGAMRKYVMKASGDDSNQKLSFDFTDKRILIAEDNALNLEIAEELLKEVGAAVDAACDGNAVVEKFRSSPIGYYDLILMDIQMPVMNGHEAARAIRKSGRADSESVPILAMTADAFAEDVALAKECGMNGHLSKPLNVAFMYKEIRKLLQK